MRQKKKCVVLFSSLALASLILAGCNHPATSSGTTSENLSSGKDSSESSSNPGSSSVDLSKADSIKIYGQFMSTVYYQGTTIDYSTLQIQTFHGKNKLATLKYSEHSDIISHTDIDTTQIATGLTFTVTYKPAGAEALQASLTYEVKVNDMTPVQWVESKTWTAFNAANSAANATKDGRNSFMESSGFYLGNKNAINLFPVVTGKDHANHLGTMNQIDSGVSATLKDAKGTSVSLDDAFSASAKSALLTKGDVDFNDDLTGEYTLTFSYGSDTTNFPDIAYDLHVVDGYNISDAKTLSIINNEPNLTSGFAADAGGTDVKTRIDAWKSANGIPLDLTVNNAVIQSDITIAKADLPSYFVWGEEADHQPVSDSMKGTLRDWAWLYYKNLTTANPTFHLYGNFHKISLGSDFPYVEEAEGPRNGTAPATGTTISSHASLFGGWNADADRGAYHYYIHDLAFTGNTGVSNKEEDKTKGGLVFFKPTYDASVENCVVNTTFIGEVNGGYYSSATDYRDCTTTWIKTRLHDTQSAQLFNWGAGSIVAQECELMNAGGPLIINQPHAYNLSGMSESDIAARKASNVIIDDKSHLENYVTGQGGWFSFYTGATSYVDQLKTMDPLFNLTLGKTFLKADATDSSIKRMNFIALNMTTSSSTDAAEGSIYGSTTIGSQKVIDYEGGRSTMTAAIAQAANDGGAAYQKALYTTDVGTTFMAQSASDPASPVFKMVGAKGDNFGMLLADSSGNPNGLANAKYYATGAKVDADKAFDDDAKTATYLGIYAFGKGYKLDVTNPANFRSWEGCNDYGLLLGLEDYKAA